MEWVRAHAGPETILLSICAGAMNLADTALLAGRSATTHHLTFEPLAQKHPRLILPGQPDSASAAAIEEWVAERGRLPVEQVQQGSGYPYDATLRDIAGRAGGAIADETVYLLEYPAGALTDAAPRYVLNPILPILGLALSLSPFASPVRGEAPETLARLLCCNQPPRPTQVGATERQKQKQKLKRRTAMASTDTMMADGKVRAGARRWGGWRLVGIVAGAITLLLVAAVAGLFMWMSYVPADLDYATTRASNAGAFRLSYEPRRGPITVNQIHAWTIHVETADGKPVGGARITVDGDMPQHGHGLPTEPQVTTDLGGGDYLVEGLKFHMPGWWVVDYTITANGQTDTVRFNLLLN